MFGEFKDDVGSSFSKDNIKDNEENYNLPITDRIVECIAKQTQVIVKSQQRFEPDLTLVQRKEALSDILEKNACQFLCRFGKHLRREHLQYFNSFSGDPEMKYYLEETQKLLNESTIKLQIRNRRFGALKKIQSSGSNYFTEKEMHDRNPMLFEELVGTNLTDEEFTSRVSENRNINSFAHLLIDQIDRNKVRDRQRQQQRFEKECEEEEEEEDEEEIEDGRNNENRNKEIVNRNNGEGRLSESAAAPVLDEGEKKLMEEEFYTRVCSNFVEGKDADFDYNKIDNAEENDLLEWRSRDEEERYFDADDDDDSALPSSNDDHSTAQIKTL